MIESEQDDARPCDAGMRNSPGLPTGYQVTLTPDSYKKMKNRREERDDRKLHLVDPESNSGGLNSEEDLDNDEEDDEIHSHEKQRTYPNRQLNSSSEDL